MIKREVQDESVKRWNAINDNVPFETSDRSMTPPIIKYIRPNNYRRLLNIKLLNESGIKQILTTPLSKRNPQNHIIDIANYRNSGISLQVCKEKLIGIYSQVYSNGKKYWYKIERETDNEINAVIEAKKEEIKDKIDNAMLMFCEEFKLNFRFEKPIWLRSETAIHGDDYIDRIPRDLIIHDTIFKKVYKDDLEFKSGKGEEPVVHLKNYITNRAIEKIAPEIARELSSLRDDLTALTHENRLMAENMTSHIPLVQEATRKLEKDSEVQRETLATLKAIQDSIKPINIKIEGEEREGMSSLALDMAKTYSKYDVERKDRIKSFIDEFK